MTLQMNSNDSRRISPGHSVYGTLCLRKVWSNILKPFNCGFFRSLPGTKLLDGKILLMHFALSLNASHNAFFSMISRDM